MPNLVSINLYLLHSIRPLRAKREKYATTFRFLLLFHFFLLGYFLDAFLLKTPDSLSTTKVGERGHPADNIALVEPQGARGSGSGSGSIASAWAKRGSRLCRLFICSFILQFHFRRDHSLLSMI